MFADVFKLIWGEVDSFVKRRLAVTLLLVLIASGLTALAPLALKLLIDGFSSGNWLMQDAGFLIFGPVALIFAYVFSQWLSRSLTEVRTLIYGTAEARLNRRLSRRLFAHIMHLPLHFHLERQSGGLNQTLVQGVVGYRIVLQHLTFTLLPVLVEMSIIGAVLAWLQPVFVLILALAMIFYSIIFILGAKQISAPSRSVSSSQVDAHGIMTDSILNYETVKYFNAEEVIQARYDGALAHSEQQWSSFFTSRMRNGLWVALIFALSLGSSTWLATQQVIQGTLTLGDFVLINAYMLQIIRPLEQLGFAFRDLAQGVAFIEKMMAIFKQAPEVSLHHQALALYSDSGDHKGDYSKKLINPGTDSDGTEPPGELLFKQVNFSYLPQRQILKDINFRVPAGKTLAIVGPSGSGKSSLIRLLVRLYQPDSGEILLNGKPISGLPLADLRAAIAVVPQDTMLFNDTIAYNIGFGKSGSTQQEITQAARLAQIDELVDSLPEQYLTRVGERGLKLSGGEKQRVSIARAALKQPQIFVFDEATSSLDSRTEKEILRNLIDISKGTTTLLIAHRLSTIIHADEILVLDQGEITERGTHDSLLQQNGDYAALWRAQQREQIRVVV